MTKNEKKSMKKKKRVKVSKSTDRICAICGRPIERTGKGSREHMFPKHALDFCLSDKRLASMSSFINGGLNKGYSHNGCNNRKSIYVLNKNDINRLHIPNWQKNILIKNSYIYSEEFSRMKESVEYRTQDFYLGSELVHKAEH